MWHLLWGRNSRIKQQNRALSRAGEAKSAFTKNRGLEKDPLHDFITVCLTLRVSEMFKVLLLKKYSVESGSF